MSLKYRPEIDGLRAIAVSSVVLFHANAALLPGGFVGVDVFFVISGFLITTILVRGLTDTSFSFTDFYERRIRRLIPPLFFMLSVSFVLALLILPAQGLRSFLWSLLATLGFSANWYFAFTADYFGGPAHTKPLLHMWSLGVEEQYYILMPFILMLALKVRRLIKPILLALVALSFAYSYHLSLNAPNFAFYGILSRFWELGVGSVLAVFAFRSPRSPGLSLLATIIGLLLILGSFFVISPNSLFPAPWALAPVLGTAVVIWATQGHDTLATRLLGLAPMVFVGKISYALYLWHWPLLLFFKMQFPEWGYGTAVVAIALSVFLSWVSLEFLENPIRRRQWFKTTRSLYVGFLAFVAVFASAAGFLLVQKPAFIDGTALASTFRDDLMRERRDWIKRALKDICWVPSEGDFEMMKRRCAPIATDRNDILIVGDSHAASWRAGIMDAYPDSHVWLMATNSCKMNPDWLRPNEPACRGIIAWLEDEADLSEVDHIVFASIPIALDQSTFVSHELLRAIEERSSAKITVMGPVTYYEPLQVDLFERFGHLPSEQLDAKFDAALLPMAFEADRVRARAYSRYNYASPLGVLCPDGPTSCMHRTEDGMPLILDGSHVYTQGSIAVIRQLVEAGELDLSPASD